MREDSLAGEYSKRSSRGEPVCSGLERVSDAGIVWHTDRHLARTGVFVAFTERGGGASRRPYASLNLAGHVGDDPRRVDENRSRLLCALGLGHAWERLTCAEQVHGAVAVTVRDAEAGAGAFAGGVRPPVPGADALLTSVPDVPLMLCFADCVPVVLVAPPPRPSVAVVHAGWRGAAAGLPASAASRLAEEAGRPCSDLLAYIGPSICPRHYEVGPDVLSRFGERFATIAEAGSRLDLAATVSAGLSEAGIPQESVCSMHACTVEHVDRFYSYRAEGVTGRHGALVAITVKE